MIPMLQERKQIIILPIMIAPEIGVNLQKN